MSLPRRHLVMRPISLGQDPTICHISATSSSVSSRGKLNNTMCCKVIAAPWCLPEWAGSVELEVLVHLPIADVLRISERSLRDSGLIPAVFGALHLQQVVDQGVAEGLAEERVLLQRADGVGERGREHRI